MQSRSKLIRMRVQNFGCIGPQGVEVELDEIVCLVGANNSGKSTVLKAYEAAAGGRQVLPAEIHTNAGGLECCVELWVHIPKDAENISEKWKFAEGENLLVRSKWVWTRDESGKVGRERFTWDPSSGEYSEDGNAAGLDTVFNSRLPKPFRIGSLEDPEEEHRKLLDLVLEPIKAKLKKLMDTQGSELRERIRQVKEEAEKPVAEFRDKLESIQTKVSKSYQKVFSTSGIHLNVNLGDISVDPAAALMKASGIEVLDTHGPVQWQQQGTGSQRTLFWSMLEVRSELNRVEEGRKAREAQAVQLRKNISKLEGDLAKTTASTKATTIADKTGKLEAAKKQLEKLTAEGSEAAEEPFLPGYMLLIDEPEAALHPSAIRAAKEHLYSLALESGWQVMLTTHHPAFVDPVEDHTTIVRLHRQGDTHSPHVYKSDSMNFDGEELDLLKSLLAFDTTVAEMFFGAQTIVVEGDTEFASFTEVMNLAPEAFPVERRPLILRARGKATIPILVRMLSHFKVNFAVLHDIDPPRTSNGTRVNSAYSVNKRICDVIESARTSGTRIIHRHSCPNFELEHGMDLPDKDKPFNAWKAVQNNAVVRESVRRVLDGLIIEPLDDAFEHPEDGRHYEGNLRTWAAEHGADNPAYVFPE